MALKGETQQHTERERERLVLGCFVSFNFYENNKCRKRLTKSYIYLLHENLPLCVSSPSF